MLRALVPFLSAASLVLAAPLAAAQEDPRIARGAAAVAPFQQQLMAALQEGLAQGPEAAIDACRVRAPELARAASSGGVRVGRTSHKLRNPANAPAPWMKPLLAGYLASPADRRPHAVDLPDGRVGYVQPILVQAPCLVCHGESIAEPLRAKLAALYPHDRATGFREGDFRGVFWAELARDD
ncbi:MAG: hypothetical protein DCC71_10670 [Proteobacteria bacterium]|nr:MAG: hypothetical protein DCC71_10670 [Pseudomonadota bacterium]